MLPTQEVSPVPEQSLSPQSDDSASSARVTSVRDVEWEDSRNGGFMFVFRPGPLSQAPHTYIGILRAPETPQTRAACSEMAAKTSGGAAPLATSTAIARRPSCGASDGMGLM